MLSQQEFTEVIDRAPLVSIDLIIRNEEGEVLLGYRDNRPAQGYWFVPGGRIRKNETLEQAFIRITRMELGFELPFSDATLLGAYDHIYDDNVFDAEHVNTHYVALGHCLSLPKSAGLDLNDQHSDMRWWPLRELLDSPLVHANTKAYFL